MIGRGAVLALVLAVWSCKDKPDVVGEFSRLADSMCRCKTEGCAEKVNEQFEGWLTKNESAKGSHSEQVRAKEIAERYTNCMIAAMGGAAPEANPAVKATPKKGIPGGMYKVGVDMPAGEYVIVGSGYLQVSSDSTGSFESIIENDNYENRAITVVAEGHYLQFKGRAYTWEEAPKVDTSSGRLSSGTYKVGVDLPAGEYKVTPTGSGYLEVRAGASGEGVRNIVSNDNFNTDRYITVSDGQYLKLKRATLKLK
jgi:hypothetical protein